jgi:glycosyltransferase involved in cell wall biosynthesis
MLFPQKNFSGLLHAFKLLAADIPHKLLVVGSPRWKYHEDLQLIGNLGLAERVQFLPHVQNEDLPAIYNLAQCFAFPSLYEAFGLVGVEALACGCPVAAARAGALPEVLGNAAVFFDPQDVSGMARSISSLLHDRVLRQACVREGLERARLFTWERTARETLQLFESLVA